MVAAAVMAGGLLCLQMRQGRSDDVQERVLARSVAALGDETSALAEACHQRVRSCSCLRRGIKRKELVAV